MHRISKLIVAMKIIPMEQGDATKEIEIIKGFTSPCVIQFYGSFIHNEELWIAMEFCGCGSISDLMKMCDTCLSEDMIACIVKQILSGLVYLHDNRKIHRDIKAGYQYC